MKGEMPISSLKFTKIEEHGVISLIYTEFCFQRLQNHNVDYIKIKVRTFYYKTVFPFHGWISRITHRTTFSVYRFPTVVRGPGSGVYWLIIYSMRKIDIPCLAGFTTDSIVDGSSILFAVIEITVRSYKQ